MTNEEKYKTPRERATAFREFCKRNKECENCPIKEQYADAESGCSFRWLALEEEKPLPCPCCGAKVEVFHISRSELDQGYHVFCGSCGLQTALEKTSDKAVALWNRRARL